MSTPVPQTAIVDSTPAVPLPVKMQRASLIAKLADRWSVDPEKLLPLLKATAFRQRADRQTGVVREPTNEEMQALLIIADKYGLDPFTKELYAYLDPKSGAIIAVVSVDGWIRILNKQPAHRSLSFAYSEEKTTHKGKTVHEYIDCEIIRSDRDKPVVIREFFNEVVRDVNFATPWDTHPNRMHRHKTLIQCARVAYGFGGLHDDDEAQRILEGESSRVAEAQPPAIARINATVRKPEPLAIEHNPGETVPAIDNIDDVVALSDEQAADILRDLPMPGGPTVGAKVAPDTAPTFALMAGAINEAATLDDLNLAVDLIRSVTSKQQQRELNLLAADKRAALTTGGKPQ